MLPRYEINAPAVTSEVIDGEAVIMHLKSGKYFSAAASGGVIWAALEEGLAVGQIVERVLAGYVVSGDEARRAVQDFCAELLGHELIRAAADDAPVLPARLGDCDARRVFTPPLLNVYSDMQDLLLLDPIHDVGEEGWPVAASA
jgi:hypothetical protein